MTDASDTIDAVDTFAAAWRAELTGHTSISATDVQDRLLDLWAQLDEGERRSRVEAWLTETLSRHLYTVPDVESRLSSL